MSEVTERISTTLEHKFNHTGWRDTPTLSHARYIKTARCLSVDYRPRGVYYVVHNFTFAISSPDAFLVVILTLVVFSWRYSRIQSTLGVFIIIMCRGLGWAQGNT